MKKLIRAEIRKRNVFSTHRLKQLLLVVLFFICLDVNAQVRRAIFMNRTGTITATTGSAIVNGVGTSFLTDLIPGNSIYKNATSTSNGVPTLGVILSIQSNTQLTLAANSAVAASGDIYCSSEFTPADFALLACTIKTYLDGHHYDYVMKHISPCNDPTDQPDDPDCVSLSGVTRERIHQTAATSPVAERGINFLPWHRHFINKLEELFMLSGMPQFV